MMTSSNGNTFCVDVPLSTESTGHRWIPPKKVVTRSFDVFFDLRLNKGLSKQSGRRWFEAPSRSLLRHCNTIGPINSLRSAAAYIAWIVKIQSNCEIGILMTLMTYISSGVGKWYIMVYYNLDCLFNSLFMPAKNILPKTEYYWGIPITKGK